MPRILAADTCVTDNTLTVKGSGLGIHVEGPLLQTNLIRSNLLSMGSGDGMLVVIPSAGGSGSVVTGNTISGTGAHGIYVNAHQPRAGGLTISTNNITVSGVANPDSLNQPTHSCRNPG